MICCWYPLLSGAGYGTNEATRWDIIQGTRWACNWLKENWREWNQFLCWFSKLRIWNFTFWRDNTSMHLICCDVVYISKGIGLKLIKKNKDDFHIIIMFKIFQLLYKQFERALSSTWECGNPKTILLILIEISWKREIYQFSGKDKSFLILIIDCCVRKSKKKLATKSMKVIKKFFERQQIWSWDLRRARWLENGLGQSTCTLVLRLPNCAAALLPVTTSVHRPSSTKEENCRCILMPLSTDDTVDDI